MCTSYSAACKLEDDKKELRKKAEEYLKRAEDLKKLIKQKEGHYCVKVLPSTCTCT